MPIRLSVALLLSLASCTSTPASPGAGGRLQIGIWGGEHVALTVADRGAHLEFDCASGEIGDPVAVDDRGRFDAAGVFVREHGGPVREGETLERVPARYAGTVAGNRLTLSVFLVGTSETIGAFTLTHGAAARVTKCL